MAHFAEIDTDNIVVRVLVVPDEQEHRGEEFLAVDLGLGGRWVQTSYNHRIRGRHAGPGDTYDPVADEFIPAPPFASWSWDGKGWQPPTPEPTEPGAWSWDEGAQEWIDTTPPED